MTDNNGNKGVGLRLRMISNAIRRYLDGNSELKEELDKLTCSNKWIIGYLYEAEQEQRDIFQKDFEEKFGITRSTVSKMLSLLEKKELVRRVVVSHDARLRKIVLTEKSRELGRAMRGEVNDIEEKLVKGFSEAELKQLNEYFDRLENNIDSAARERKGAEKRGNDD